MHKPSLPGTKGAGSFFTYLWLSEIVLVLRERGALLIKVCVVC